MTEWWQYLVYGLLTLFFGSLVGYWFTRLGASQERKSRERDELRNAVHNILAEVETNLKLARHPWQDKIMPFIRSMWDAYSGHILGLSKDLRDGLHRLYVEVQMANALFELNLHLPHGSGYHNNAYREQCKKIVKEAEEAKRLLVKWLQEEGIEVLDADKTNRQSP